MKLNLDADVLRNHIQKYSKSCVPMGIELALKLMGQAEINYYEIQDEKGDNPSSGWDFNGKIYRGTRVNQEFPIVRGATFPLDDLFNRIIEELNAGGYVHCAWKEHPTDPYHAFIIYGYEGDELLAVTKYHNNSNVRYVNDMKRKLTDIQGSDILTFTIV